MTTPTPYEARIALESRLFELLSPAYEAGEIVIVQPGEEVAPDLKKIQVIHTVNPGIVEGGEVDIVRGISPRIGVYIITLSVPNDVQQLSRAWELAGELEQGFRGVTLSSDKGKVYVNEPYTTNVGELPDSRLGLSVTVNWWAWTGGKGAE